MIWNKFGQDTKESIKKVHTHKLKASNWMDSSAEDVVFKKKAILISDSYFHQF